MMLADERYWSVKDFCKVYSVSRSWVYEQVARGKLPYNRLGGLIRFSPPAIRTWMNSQMVVPRVDQ